MRFEIYMSVGGQHFDAEVFALQAAVPGAQTKVIGERGAQVCPDRVKRLQVWETQRAIASNHPGIDIKGLLLQHEGLIALLENEDRNSVNCWVTIVGYYDVGEEPRGFTFDRETIALLNRFGASLEIDAVHDLADETAAPTQ